MLKPHASIFLQRRLPDPDRTLYGGRLLAVEPDGYHADFALGSLDVAPEVELLLFHEREDGFAQEPVRVCGVDTLASRLLLELQRIGPASAAERRSSPRIPTWSHNLRAVLGAQRTTVIEIGARGLGVEAAPGLAVGAELEIHLQYRSAPLSGRVSVRSARPFGPAGSCYGLLCLAGGADASDLMRALPRIHRELLLASSGRRSS
jgi:hypothetical protein